MMFIHHIADTQQILMKKQQVKKQQVKNHVSCAEIRQQMAWNTVLAT